MQIDAAQLFFVACQNSTVKFHELLFVSRENPNAVNSFQKSGSITERLRREIR